MGWPSQGLLRTVSVWEVPTVPKSGNFVQLVLRRAVNRSQSLSGCRKYEAETAHFGNILFTNRKSGMQWRVLYKGS